MITMVENIENTALPPKEPDISETTENYLKRIYILSTTKGRARISDIAQLMGRTLSSVSEAVKRMADEGLLNYEKYGKITLTDTGREVAEGVHNNYSVLNDLLQTLGIPEPIAMEDACSMEHSISQVTIQTLSNFISYAQDNPELQKVLNEFIENNDVEIPEGLDFLDRE